MKLTQYIADLLLKNNCVIIPDFGGFIANYQPAVIDELRQKIYPPTKHVLFNANLVSNDGLLANYVAKQIKTTYADALSKINTDVELWHQDLKAGKRIEIGEIGFLYSENQQIKFEQNKTYNLLLSAYGLSEIQFITSLKEDKKVESAKKDKTTTRKTGTSIENTTKKRTPLKVVPIQEAVIAVEVKKDENKKSSTKVVKLEPKKRRKNWKYVAVACAIPLLFYSYWIPMNTNILNTGNIKVSDFNPFGHPSQQIYASRDDKHFNPIEQPKNKTWNELIEHISPNVKVYNYQLDENLYIPVLLSNSHQAKDIDNVDVEVNQPNEKVSKKVITNNVVTEKVHLISGCFSDKHNAEMFVAELKSKGYNAHIVDKNKGLYRVSAQSFSSKSEAKSFKQKLADDGYSSWILN